MATAQVSVPVSAQPHGSSMPAAPSVTPVSVKEYSHKVYTSLDDFEDVAKAFKSRKGKYFIRALREIYLNHNVEDTLGVALVHRHFDMQPDELLVQDGAVSRPWGPEELRQANVLPTSWVFRGDNLYPYEYEAAAPGATAAALPAEFLIELRDVLKAFHYDQALGITTFSRGPTMFEHTEGRANILTEHVGDPASDHTVPAIWGFVREPKAGESDVQESLKCEIKCDWFYDDWGMTAGKMRNKSWADKKSTN